MRGIDIELDKPRKLRYDFNAVADLEDKGGLGIGAMFTEERIGFSSIRLLLWGGLKWEDKGLTLDRAGNMIQAYIEGGNDLADLMTKITEALTLSGILGKQGEMIAEAAN